MDSGSRRLSKSLRVIAVTGLILSRRAPTAPSNSIPPNCLTTRRMKHEVTIISDDCRFEVGNKVSLEGIYDEAIVFRSLPTRLLKLSFYQRWSDFVDVEKVTVVIRGSAIGNLELRPEAKPPPGSKRIGTARIMFIIGPIDFLSEGTLEFQTFLNDESQPRHTHLLSVRTDPNLNF